MEIVILYNDVAKLSVNKRKINKQPGNCTKHEPLDRQNNLIHELNSDDPIRLTAFPDFSTT